jgi:hypothetical protein
MRTVPQITAVDIQLIDESTTNPQASIRITDVDSSWSEYDNQFVEDSGNINTVYATMENTGQLPIEPTLDLEIYRGDRTGSTVAGPDVSSTPIYSEENAQVASIETPPGQTQDFTMSPLFEIDTADEYTIEVTLRESGSSGQLDTATRVITVG